MGLGANAVVSMRVIEGVVVVARTNGRSVVVVGQPSTLKEAGICPSSRIPYRLPPREQVHAQSPPSSGLGFWFSVSDPEWQDHVGAAVVRVSAGSVTVVGSSVRMFSNDVSDGKVKLLKI